MSLGHSGGQGGHGGHGGHGHHGHSGGGGQAMGGGGPQETWTSALKETRFGGELYRSPLIPLVAYGMVVASVVIVVCFADSNLLEFAVSQHKEAQQKHDEKLKKEMEEAAEASGSQAEDAQPVAQGASQSAASDASSVAAQQQPAPQGLPASVPPAALSAPNQMSGYQPAQQFQPAYAQPQTAYAQPQPAQTGYLQQSLQGGYGSNKQYGESEQAFVAGRQAYGAYSSTGPAAGAFVPSYPASGSAAYQQPGYPAQPYQAAGLAPMANLQQHGNAWLQGGYKTGADGVTRVPMNRMVVNR